MYDNLDKENKKNESLFEKPPLTAQFIEKRTDIDRSTLFRFAGPFQLLQADIAYISILAKTQNFVFYLSIYLHRKYIPFQ